MFHVPSFTKMTHINFVRTIAPTENSAILSILFLFTDTSALEFIVLGRIRHPVWEKSK